MSYRTAAPEPRTSREIGWRDGYVAACDDARARRSTPRTCPTGRTNSYQHGWAEGYAEGVNAYSPHAW
jgi:hypothetical protein